MTTTAGPPFVPTLSPPSRYVTTRLPVRRFTVDEYHWLIEHGFFASDERFELLEGWIVAKMSRNPVHDAAIDVALHLLMRLMPAGWHVRCQSGFTTIDSEPEPDLVVVRGEGRDYIARHPGPPDAAVVIEIANTTLADDRELKGRLYARAGVGVYWIVNLIDRTIEVYSQPSPAGVPAYARRDVFAIEQAVTFSVDSARVGPIPVAQLMP